MVWEGRDAVKTGRVMLGATNPADSAPGTIRGDYAIDVGRNICHGSDAVASYVSVSVSLSPSLPPSPRSLCLSLDNPAGLRTER